MRFVASGVPSPIPLRMLRAMTERDVEKDCAKDYFVDTLRRLADSLEQGEAFRVQVAGKRFTVPADARLAIEHEASAGDEELELQLCWSGGEG